MQNKDQLKKDIERLKRELADAEEIKNLKKEREGLMRKKNAIEKDSEEPTISSRFIKRVGTGLSSVGKGAMKVGENISKTDVGSAIHKRKKYEQD